jgi:transcription antitermination factor NusG
MSVVEIYKTRLDALAWEVFAGAIEYSQHHNQNHVFADHFIRQVFLERRDLFDKILQSLNVSTQDFQGILEKRINDRPHTVSLSVCLDDEVIRMLQSALSRARTHGRLTISQSDMLLALGRDERGTLQESFAAVGVDPLAVIAAIEAVVASDQDDGSPAVSEKSSLPFAVGDMIRITSGAFAAMSARVAAVDGGKSRLHVKVNIYGRSDTIELSFTDVEKISFD